MIKKGDHIILIGMSGAGKTTIGEALSTGLNLPFIDTDEEIVNKTGSSVLDIFRLEGEAKFRSYESGIVRQLVDFPKSVIAVGGGLPCYHNQMQLLLEMGKVIYLNAPLDVVMTRLNQNINSRPLYINLDSDKIEQKTVDLKMEREKVYLQADFEIDTNQHIDKLVKEIIEKLS